MRGLSLLCYEENTQLEAEQLNGSSVIRCVRVKTIGIKYDTHITTIPHSKLFTIQMYLSLLSRLFFAISFFLLLCYDVWVYVSNTHIKLFFVKKTSYFVRHSITHIYAL